MKILFVTHDTSRTGAPMVVLYFMRWIRAHFPDVTLGVVALREGALKEDFKAVSDHYYVQGAAKSRDASITKSIRTKLGFAVTLDTRKSWMKPLLQTPYDIVYANTIVALPVGEKLKSLWSDTKLLVHVHELQAIIKQIRPDMADYIPKVHQFIAASDIVKSNLLAQWKIPQEKVTRVYECSQIETASLKEKAKKTSFVVGGSGTAHWRKGSDLFVQVAMLVNRAVPDVNLQFVWIGNISKNERIILEEDIRKCSLENVVSFVGETDNPVTYYSDFDVFLMTSREDPFPLVCIEVGMLGTPIITFDKATGTSEIIKDKGGVIVPYLDTNAMAQAVLQYIEDETKLDQHGSYNKKAFTQFTPEVICPQLWEVIHNT